MRIGLAELRRGSILVLLVVLQFALRPFLVDVRGAPDFLLLALLVYAIRARPGEAAIAGFLIGIVTDALAPVAVGAGALAHTCVGWLAAWGKAVFFAENLFVSAAFFFAGTWLRDALMLLAGRQLDTSTWVWELVVWSPLRGFTTALAGVIVLAVFHRWLDVRITA